eukprot:UN28428
MFFEPFLNLQKNRNLVRLIMPARFGAYRGCSLT